ncbi:MAG: hypothetical protein AUH85_00935 [Chloroflexi bacterium 13_1_40CM_4_68_4]|nr:MAG: hypothetical protein AUH85_00935 [Chloroflexi bacterium 13_1_40CM_4_68_4]
MGAGGVLPARTALVTREQAALLRLVLVCVAWAIGETLAIGVSLAIGVYIVTGDIGRRSADVNARYWRGRRIDDKDSGPRHWN